jgi:RHS repeat-associated protein
MVSPSTAESGVASYSHTDALGSPVARTNAAGQITSRTRYEAYGATAAGTNPTGIGFTGHVNDADTGLVYMQQRYYDPVAGRFLSVDPVTTEFKSGGHFNRYAYGENNPYKFTDPDGEAPQSLIPDEAGGGGLGRGGRYADVAPRGADGGPVRLSIADTRANLQAARAGQVKANAEQGKAGEAQVKAEMGATATGSQVTFRTSDGSKTIVDITKSTNGAIEVKTGNAQLSANQGKMKADVEAGRAVTPVGKNAEAAGFTPGKPVQLETFEVKRVTAK